MSFPTNDCREMVYTKPGRGIGLSFIDMKYRRGDASSSIQTHILLSGVHLPELPGVR